jgi:hypothetical protein
MAEIAEMMLDGTLCQSCGCFVGSRRGVPVSCVSCRRPVLKLKCTHCGKRVKPSGMRDHVADKHSDDDALKGGDA